MVSAPCLITGGAGFLGINLARLLLSAGWTVRSLDIADFNYPEKSSVDAIVGDIRDSNAVSKAMNDVSVVVHCAAALPLADRAEILSTGIEGTRLLLEAAWRSGVKRFIFISSTAVYGVPDHVPILEDDALKGVGPYGQSKIEAENLCRDYQARGMLVTILRPKSFVGPERLGAFELLYDWAFDGHGFPVLGKGENHYQLLDVEDLCQVILLCMTADTKLVADTFNVGAKRYGTMRENFQTVLDRAGHGKKVVALPAKPAVLLLRLLEWLRLSPLYQWIYATADHESVVSIDRLIHKLGYTPRYSNGEALVRNYDWYVAHRPEFKGQTGVSHRVPWRRGVLGVAKWFF